MVQNNKALNQGPFIPPAKGGVPHDEPDGWTTTTGGNALRDYTGHPLIESGDWQSNWRPGLKSRGRP